MPKLSTLHEGWQITSTALFSSKKKAGILVLTCSKCGTSENFKFGPQKVAGMTAFDRSRDKGWRNPQGKEICPECMRKANKAWEERKRKKESRAHD